jgi:acyl dehydratase
MTGILETRSYPEAVTRFRWDDLWALFDGSPGRLNLAHECVDRHAPAGVALRIQLADGRREEHGFAALAAWSSRFAWFLEREGIGAGDRVAIMLDPGLAFYAALFGTVKRGAIAVPLFTLFGPEGLAMRVTDCAPRLLLVPAEPERWAGLFPGLRVAAADDALLRGLIGQPIRRPEPYIEVATRDAIRHWAHGIGDRNPHWAAHAVAPPTILFAMDRIVSGYVTGLPGIHAMYAGTDFRWQQPIREGDRVVGDSVLLDLEEKPSAFARRAFKQTYRTTFRRPDGAVVCEADSWCFRTERDTARERRKYAPREPHRYSAGDIERIRDAYRREEIRGAAPRYWEDVSVGEALPEVVKGPLTVTSVVAFVQGWGSLYVRAHGLAFDLFEHHPALGIPNAFGVPEPPERVHWDDALARAVGVPSAYDYGPERVAWLGHLVTNWMGDDGVLERLSVQVRRHNLIGDTAWCRGTVAAKADGQVTVDLAAVNQRGETIAAGEARVRLPRR